MKIKIEMLNDYKYPAESKKAITTGRIFHTDADKMYEKLVKLLQEEEKKYEKTRK